MKKNLTSIILWLSLTMNAFAQFDTTSALYDFEALPNGNLNGIDNWSTTPFNTTIDWRISDTLYANVGKGIFFNQTGPNVGVSGSRLFDTLFPGFTFDQSLSTYIYQFDIVRNYWGVDIGICADLNNDGKTIKTDTQEKALIFRSSSLNGETLTAPNGTVYTMGNNLSNAWFTIRITIKPFTGNFGGTVDVEYQPIFSGTWNTMASGLPLYVDSLSTTKTNITRWNNIYLHSEGAVGKVDELRFTKISPLVNTGIVNVSSSGNQVYYSEGYIRFKNAGATELIDIRIFDSVGKLIHSNLKNNRNPIDISNLRSGLYAIQMISAHQKVQTLTVFIP